MNIMPLMASHFLRQQVSLMFIPWINLSLKKVGIESRNVRHKTYEFSLQKYKELQSRIK